LTTAPMVISTLPPSLFEKFSTTNRLTIGHTAQTEHILPSGVGEAVPPPVSPTAPKPHSIELDVPD
jgi:hypothetical protein